MLKIIFKCNFCGKKEETEISPMGVRAKLYAPINSWPACDTCHRQAFDFLRKDRLFIKTNLRKYKSHSKKNPCEYCNALTGSAHKRQCPLFLKK